jgi:hypothetical protein
MGVTLFFKYLQNLIRNFVLVTSPNDVILSLGLYLVYPAILYLLLDKFHGLCGKETYLKKEDAIAACQGLYLWFTILLRTNKLGVIILYSVDASDKGSNPDLDSDGAASPPPSGGVAGLMAKLKCQTLMHLSRELAAVAFVAFLLLVCLPVLAFWFMFLSILVSAYNLFTMFRRLWNESQDSIERESDDDGSNDLEFQDFLSNFTDGNQESS